MIKSVTKRRFPKAIEEKKITTHIIHVKFRCPVDKCKKHAILRVQNIF